MLLRTVIRERTFKLPRFIRTESAEFFVLLASDGKSKTVKVEDVKFISGSDKMKLQAAKTTEERRLPCSRAGRQFLHVSCDVGFSDATSTLGAPSCCLNLGPCNSREVNRTWPPRAPPRLPCSPAGR